MQDAASKHNNPIRIGCSWRLILLVLRRYTKAVLRADIRKQKHVYSTHMWKAIRAEPCKAKRTARTPAISEQGPQTRNRLCMYEVISLLHINLPAIILYSTISSSLSTLKAVAKGVQTNIVGAKRLRLPKNNAVIFR